MIKFLFHQSLKLRAADQFLVETEFVKIEFADCFFAKIKYEIVDVLL